MHNCKRTREELTEMAAGKAPPDQTRSLWVELERCDACREEYASLRNAFRIVNQALQSALPAENFWPDYHSRLRQRLEGARKSRSVDDPSKAGILARLRKFVTASVRVPVPLAAGVAVLLIISVVFTIFSRNALRVAPAQPVVITKTVEVPVIREKPVTVYVERNRHPARHPPRPKQTEQNALTTIARRQRETNPASLVGFKPANEVKLTIIKGSYRDDK